MAILHRPDTLAEVCELLAADDAAMVYGGGTAIQILRKQGILFASAFVDLSRVAGLDELRGGPGGIRAGPMVSIRRMETDPLVTDLAPLAAAAYSKVANPRVRNTASVGGNLAHGDYRLDPPVALLVLGAVIEVTSTAGARRVPTSEFFVDFQQTALGPGELVTAVDIPVTPGLSAGHYVKLSSLSANDWPAASAAAAFLDGGAESRVLRLAVGALAPVPRFVQLDVTGANEEETIDVALQGAETLMDPIPDVRGSATYKRRLGRVAVEDAVRGAWKEARHD